ncbi:hypothetical protein R1sor_008543 [Riccia sorocarpa]|uniref:Uncharacterized protein n=1 Tax=Riccia sorocarpa TaxID=122646 RepID=A0ABD3HTR2_9MARC
MGELFPRRPEAALQQADLQFDLHLRNLPLPSSHHGLPHPLVALDMTVVPGRQASHVEGIHIESMDCLRTQAPCPPLPKKAEEDMELVFTQVGRIGEM